MTHYDLKLICDVDLLSDVTPPYRYIWNHPRARVTTKCQHKVKKRPLQFCENNDSGFMLLTVQIGDSCNDNQSGQITWNISTECQVGTIKTDEKIAKNECAKH